MRKFFKAAYYTNFEFDRFIILALFLAMSCTLLVFVFDSFLFKYIFTFLSGLFFWVPLVYLLFQPLTYRLIIQRYALDLNKNELIKLKKTKSDVINKKCSSLRIVFLTDIHLHEFLPSDYIHKLIKKTNDLKTDILIFGGDYIVDELTDLRLLEQLKGFEAKIKLGVLGNHDYNMKGKDFRENKITSDNFRFADEICARLKAVGINILQNTNLIIKDKNGHSRLNIFGLDDLWVKKSDMSKFKPAKYNIIVTHNPQNFTDLNDSSINLVISGHNHGGGQLKLNKYISLHRAAGLIPLSPFSFFPEEFGKYIAGVYKNDYGIKMYSSTGVGITGLGVRINCRPEIVVIDII